MKTLTYELLLAGLAVGGAAALSGVGLVVTHRATGVLNLAHGAVAMVCAYVLRQLTVEWGWPLGPAACLTLLVVAPGIGLLLDRAVFRPVASGGGDDPARALVASIGVFVLLVGGAALVWGGGARADVPVLLGDAPWTWPAVAVAVALAVGAATRWTGPGRELRAVVDDRELASLGGIAADRVAAAGWAFGSFTAGLTGVLLAPYVRLDPYGLPLLVLEVVAVAVAARMRSLPVAVAVALAVGVAQAQLTRLHPEGWAGPLVGAVAANLFAVALLVAALVVPAVGPDGSDAPGRGPRDHGPAGYAGAGRGPTGYGPRGYGPGARGAAGTRVPPAVWPAVAVLFLLPLGLAGPDLRTAVQVPALAVALLSLVVVTGRAGQISLGQAAYAGLGALFTAWLAAGRLPGLPRLPEPAALAVAVLLVAPLGLLVGRPAIRRRGPALALVTLAVGVVVSRFVLAQPYATAGLVVERPAGFLTDRRFYVLELLVLAGALAAVGALRRGRTGRALAALRDHEPGAAAAGVPVPGLKLLAFVAGAALAALGGGLLGMGARAFDAAAFDPVRALLWFAVVVVLGADSLLAPLVGAALLVGLDAGARGGAAAALVGLLAAFAGRVPPLTSLLPARTRRPTRARAADRPPPDAPAPAPGPGPTATPGREAIPGREAAPARAGGPGPQHDSARAPKRGPAPPDARAGADGPPPAHRPTPVRRRAPWRRTPPPGPPVAGASGTAPRLRAHGLTVRYAGATALDGVDLAPGPGRVTALVGPNGAGKSTLFHCLAGAVRPAAGRVTLDGTDITRRPAHARARLGIARTFQEPAVFPTLTVEENVLLGAEQGRVRDAPRTAAEQALRLLGLDGPVRHRPAAGLPTGTLRRIELGRALAGRPHTLLLDEPTAGLDDAETAALARVLAALAADGTAVLVVAHDPDLVAGIAHTVHVLEAGRIVA
ncbi:ABC transporter permease subunit [Streptomyces kanasensis]|uniref:ABC transporter permease subunit n=1 Tax=Streptomyces kanasensis TaxID=936756 RepID=UPI0037F2EF8E